MNMSNAELIRIRDDDVLVKSSGWLEPFERLIQIHEWICESPKLIHVPTLLVTEIQEIPECIEYVREETKQGRMAPEIHGFQHIDYGKLSGSEVKDHLRKCQDYFSSWGLPAPTRFYTPWGASQPHIHEAAEECGLKVVDTSKIIPLEGGKGIVSHLRNGEPLSNYYGKEIFIHWWGGGLRLFRVAQVAKHGSWEAAALANPEEFK